MSFFVEFFQLITSVYVWLPTVLILVFLTWRNNRRIKEIEAVESSLLVIEIPKANDKSELAAEQLFAFTPGYPTRCRVL